MATQPTPGQLMTLGMFLFGLQGAAFDSLTRSRDWRHGVSERHGARDAAQFIGPGQDSISLSGLIVPELGGAYTSLQVLAAMADTGDHYPLIDGQGRVLGHYRIERMEEEFRSIMAGGAPRQIGFRLELRRGDDAVDTSQRPDLDRASFA